MEVLWQMFACTCCFEGQGLNLKEPRKEPRTELALRWHDRGSRASSRSEESGDELPEPASESRMPPSSQGRHPWPSAPLPEATSTRDTESEEDFGEPLAGPSKSTWTSSRGTELGGPCSGPLQSSAPQLLGESTGLELGALPSGPLRSTAEEATGVPQTRMFACTRCFEEQALNLEEPCTECARHRHDRGFGASSRSEEWAAELPEVASESSVQCGRPSSSQGWRLCSLRSTWTSSRGTISEDRASVR